ncbi:LysR family transcriptional regulator ArgP [Nitrincola schmidtii]|uniref:LysR family transcriptional regulator ArgP n=1 Tax=Nitrincola schmidtii TaxID=1730894 RepID=UPI00124C19B6|nr:LysR family transcriptional regulator ArgP [Nitrincola schmidtii]
MIDYRLLQAMAAVLEQGGFERAANTLHLTQSAVSQRIKQLEQQLGQPVLIRSIPPKATSLGQRLHNHLQQVRQLEAGLELSANPDDLIVRITVNADSLDTWLPAALVLPTYPLLRFEVSVEDQAVGLRRMKQGEVMACLCASDEVVNGGGAIALGIMRYRALASPEFIARFELNTADPVKLRQAPCLVYSRDDRLQHQFMAEVAGTEPVYTHHLPSSEGFIRAACAGLGYGMMPELQVKTELENGSLVDLVPGYSMDVPLYWHYWQMESPVMEKLRQSVLAAARQALY